MNVFSSEGNIPEKFLIGLVMRPSLSHQTLLWLFKGRIRLCLWRVSGVSSCRNTRLKFWSADPSCLADIFKRWCYSCEIKAALETQSLLSGFRRDFFIISCSNRTDLFVYKYFICSNTASDVTKQTCSCSYKNFAWLIIY